MENAWNSRSIMPQDGWFTKNHPTRGINGLGLNSMDIMNYQYINLAYLDLMTEGDPVTRQTLVDLLIEELDNTPDQMRMAFLRSDWKGLMRMAHKFKSSLGFVGNSEMIHSNQALWEGLNQDKDPDEILGYLLSLEQLAPLAAADLLKERKS